MKVIEQFLKGKNGLEKCEDSLFISEHFVAVIDGVTSKSDYTYEGKTTGKLASTMIAEQLESLPEAATAQQFIASVNQRFESFYKSVSFPYNKREKGLQAVCAVYSGYWNEIWLIGDCQVSADGKVYLNPKKSDEILSELRSMILTIWEREKMVGEAEKKQAREMILPWILKATMFANDDTTEYGYACINGDVIPDSLIKIITLDKSVSHEIILTSDGYPKIGQSLEMSESYLKEILKLDPDCYKTYKSTKGKQKECDSFDDRAYVRFYT